MPCTRPLRGYRAQGGRVTLQRSEGYADLPVEIACGQCLGCRVSRAEEWTTRLIHELQFTRESCRACNSLSAVHTCGACFITLTYDEDHIPLDYGLQKSDWQKFAKKLRKKCGPFRYYHAGEYGTESLRPHYHAILFGIDFAEDRVLFAHNIHGDPRYLSETLSTTWENGNAELSHVTKASAAYVAKYTVKKATQAGQEETYRRTKGTHEWFVQPEYATMSLRPAIGKKWFEKYKADIYPSDETILEGKHRKTPRYYDKLLTDAERAQLKSTRKEKIKKYKEKLTTERLEAQEYIIQQRVTKTSKI